MPFFLVTYTGLVEADDEAAAAKRAVLEIRSGRALNVAVRSDETTSNSFTVPAQDRDGGAPTEDKILRGTESHSAPLKDEPRPGVPELNGRNWPMRPPMSLPCVAVGTVAFLVIVYLIAEQTMP